MLLRYRSGDLPIPDAGDEEEKKEPVTLAAVVGLGLEEKLALLSISHRFCFDNIFKYVLREIEPGDIPVLERIRLGDKYRRSSWLSSAYETLLDHDSGRLSMGEANALGLERITALLEAKCFMLQERLQIAEGKANKSFSCSNCNYQGGLNCRNCGYRQNNQGTSNVVTLAPTCTRLVVEKYFHV